MRFLLFHPRTPAELPRFDLYSIKTQQISRKQEMLLSVKRGKHYNSYLDVGKEEKSNPVTVRRSQNQLLSLKLS